MELKRQSLLKKDGKKNKKKLTPNQQSASANAQVNTVEKANTSNKQKFYFWFALVIVLALFPKPQLLTYQKLNVVSKSVYWPGFFGIGEQLFDSHLHPRFDTSQNLLYLCHQSVEQQHCNKYQVIEQQGPFAALGHWLQRIGIWPSN